MDPRRAVPSVDRVVTGLQGLPHALLVDCAREAVDAAREAVSAGTAVDLATVVADASARVDRRRATLLRPVVNATGVIVHTNLGRSPISADALRDATPIATRYSNLEYELDSGERGSRHTHAGALLARACGAEAGLVVNNNAAAVLLSLGALARGRDVVVSRGELVEIGGGFRVPEIMEESGCRLIEVGTTNRTRLSDYQRACGTNTALLLKVHASNYRMVGFVESTPVAELAGLGLPVMVDAGSGLLDDTTPWLAHRPAWLHDEPGVRQAVADGADVVTFSGDKLLGGPQAGVIVGRADLVAQIAQHPLARAVRADKVTLATLQSVAFAYLDGDASSIPLWRMATTPVEQLRRRAEAIVSALSAGERAVKPGGAPGVKVIETDAAAGGGSLPGLTIPSIGVAIAAADPEALHARMRALGVVARIADGALVCDLRTVDDSEDETLIGALHTALDSAPH